MAKLYFYYSTMNAGKSTSLLQSSHNYRERGMRTLVYTAELDKRGGGRVHSRIGLSSDALHFSPGSDLFQEVECEHGRERVSCVLLDEAQFLTRAQVEQLRSEIVALSSASSRPDRPQTQRYHTGVYTYLQRPLTLGADPT